MKSKKIVGLFLACILCVGTVAQPVHAAKSVSSAKKDVQKAEKEKKKAEAEQRELKTRLNKVMNNLETTQAKVNKKEDEIAAAEDELVAAEIKENEQYESMLIRIKYMYENGDVEMLEVLFTAESMADFLNKAEYVRQVSEYDRKMLGEFREVVKEVEEKKSALQSERKKLVTLQDELSTERAKVKKLLSSKTAEVSSLEADYKKAKKLLAAAEEAERRRKEEEEANKKPPVSNGGGSSSGGSGSGGSDKPGKPIISGNGFLSNPCPSAYISSEYGPRKAPVPGASTFHEGRDYAAPSGTPIYASADGRVIRKGYQAVRGNYVVVDHGDGIVTWYQHCTSIFVQEGQKVSRGQNIATVGATGRVSGPHLHFIVQVNGRLVDPRKYL